MWLYVDHIPIYWFNTPTTLSFHTAICTAASRRTRVDGQGLSRSLGHRSCGRGAVQCYKGMQCYTAVVSKDYHDISKLAYHLLFPYINGMSSINGSCYPNSLDFTSSSSSINHKRNRSWSGLNKFSLHELVLRSERWTSYRRVVPVTGPMLGGTDPWSQLMRSCPGAVVLWNVELFQCSNVHIIPVVMSQHLESGWNMTIKQLWLWFRDWEATGNQDQGSIDWARFPRIDR